MTHLLHPNDRCATFRIHTANTHNTNTENNNIACTLQLRVLPDTRLQVHEVTHESIENHRVIGHIK